MPAFGLLLPDWTPLSNIRTVRPHHYFSLPPPVAARASTTCSPGLLASAASARWFCRRVRFAADRIARAGSFATAVLLAGIAACHAAWSTIPVLVAAGMAWVSVVATVNVAAQVALPGWVRARGLSSRRLLGIQALAPLLDGTCHLVNDPEESDRQPRPKTLAFALELA
jgi:hypothetical protein